MRANGWWVAMALAGAGSAAVSDEAPKGVAAPASAVHVAKVKSELLNVRSGPGTSHGIVAVLKRGNEVAVDGVEGDWCKLKTPSGEKARWVSTKHLDLDVTAMHSVKEIQDKEMVDKLARLDQERRETLAKIEREHRESLQKLISEPVPTRPLMFTGTIAEWGPQWNGTPGSHKLMKGNRVVCHLRAADEGVDLGKFYGKYVAVQGQETRSPFYPEPVMIIRSLDQVVALDAEPESAQK